MANEKLKEHLMEKYVKNNPSMEVDTSEEVESTSTDKEEDNELQKRDEFRGRKESADSDDQSEREGLSDTEQHQEQAERQVKARKAKKTGDDEDKPYIPSFVLKQEKEKLRQAELARQEAERKMQALEAALLVAKQPAAKAAEEDPEPDFAVAPDDWYLWKIRQQDKRLQKYEENFTKSTQQMEAERQIAAINYSIDSSIASYKREKPDFDEAFQFMLKRQAQQNRIMGMGDQESADSIRLGLLKLAAKAQELGATPAEMYYEIARAWGYEGKQAQQRKPSLSRLNENVRKNIGFSGASGESEDGSEEYKETARKPIKDIGSFLGAKNQENLRKWKSEIRKVK